MSFTFVLIVLAVLLVFGTPVWAALLFSSIPYFLVNNVPLTIVPVTMSAGTITSFLLLAFPLFTLAGRLMNTGGVTDRIFNFSVTNFGWIRGGLGHVNVVASIIFAGMSGSAIADIGGLGAVEIDGMTKRGYDLDFSTGITLASSTIGPIIPPSTPIIIYAVIANESVAALFLGGIIPGLLMGLSLMIMIYFISAGRDYVREPFPTLRQALTSTRDVILPILNPVIILAGMVFGIFTPTEAAAVAVAYSVFLGAIVYRELSWKRIFNEIAATAKFCSSVYVIVGASMVFSFIVTREQVGIHLVELITSLDLGRTGILLLLAALVLVLGCFIEVTALIILVLPIIIPVLRVAQISLVHFGVLFIMTALMGILTPPFGLGLYIASGMTGMPFKRVVRSVAPFLIPLILVIVLIIFVPDTVMLIPRRLFRV